jgi:hypothetical protein
MVFSPVVGKGVDRIVCKLGLPYLVCSSYRGVKFRVFSVTVGIYQGAGVCVTGSLVEFFSVSKQFLYVCKIFYAIYGMVY